MTDKEYVSDLLGKKINGMLVIGSATEKTKDGNKQLIMKCHCGKEFVTLETRVRKRRRKSCGCLRNPHGDTGTQLHYAWSNMKQRCNNPNAIQYASYGGRGITYHNEWEEYILFKKWAEENGFQEGLTLERVDNNGNYEPKNCKWISMENQARNRRVNSHSKSGVSGVSWKTAHQKWYVVFYIDKKQCFLGEYTDLSEAIEIRKEAELEYWGHTNITDEQVAKVLKNNKDVI